MEIQVSKQLLVNTDPEEWEYQNFETLETLSNDTTMQEAEDRLKWWIELNDYAVSETGKGRRKKYRIMDTKSNI